MYIILEITANYSNLNNNNLNNTTSLVASNVPFARQNSSRENVTQLTTPHPSFVSIVCRRETLKQAKSRQSLKSRTRTFQETVYFRKILVYFVRGYKFYAIF